MVCGNGTSTPGLVEHHDYRNKAVPDSLVRSESAARTQEGDEADGSPVPSEVEVTDLDGIAPRHHPATFPQKILAAIQGLLATHGNGLSNRRLLDPFAGIGTIASLGEPWTYFGCELEPEWAVEAKANGMIVHAGDARCMPWPDGFFGAVVTSPAYGNRLADRYAPDLSDPKHGKRRSYRIYLGRDLTSGSGAAEHWGPEYRGIHEAVWRESVRVLAPGGLFLLNSKDHSRKGTVQPVTEWHVRTLLGLGLVPVAAEPVVLKGDQNTGTMRSRGVQVVDHEWVVVMKKDGTDVPSSSPALADQWVRLHLVPPLAVQEPL